MSDLEDRLLHLTCRLAFLSDFVSQPTPFNAPSMELTQDGRYGLSYVLGDIRQEAEAIRQDYLSALYPDSKEVPNVE